jgi:hypothetical protein
MRICTRSARRHTLRALAVTVVARAVVFLLAPETMQGVVRLVRAWDAGAVTLLRVTWYLIDRATGGRVS